MQTHAAETACHCAESAKPQPDPKLVKGLDDIIDPYRGKPSGLIQVLAKAQEYIGYLPRWALIQVADSLNLSLQDVYGVVTFYAFFSLVPRGRHKVCVCLGTACYVKGANKLVKGLRNELGIKLGETTPDSRFTIDGVRCIGACGLAPALLINGNEVVGKVEVEQLPEVLAKYE